MNILKRISLHHLVVILITLFCFCWAGFDVMHYHGMVGVTLRGPDPYGCICHGISAPTDTVLVTVTGPHTVIAGSSNHYTITMRGGPAVEGGFDLTVGSGEVYPVDTTTQRMWNFFTKFELTHLVPKAYDSGAVSWEFSYQAPN